MIITLNNKTHPEVEILGIDIEHRSVIFKNRDGVCSAPLAGDFSETLPTKEDLTTAIDKVLFETLA